MKRILHVWSVALTLGLLVGVSSCSKDDTVAPPTVNVPQNTVAFKAFDTEVKTVTVESSADWTFEVTGDTQICEVTREEGGNTLTVTPKINYDKVAHTAQIVITAGSGSNTTSQTITVTQEANAETYLTILNADLTGDNPIVTISNNSDGGATEYEIRLATNNKLSVVYSQDQTAPSTTALTPEKETRAAIDGCNWITYEVSEETTAEGTVTVLKLSCTFNEDTAKSRTAFLEIVSGEGTNNTVLKKRIGITQMADTPTIIVNPQEGLVATYDQKKELTFSVAANVEFKTMWPNGKPNWLTLTETTEEGSKAKVRNFSVSFQEWSGLSDREALLSLVAVDESDASADLKIKQTAAPQASISINATSVVFNNGDETKSKFIDAQCSFSTMEVTTKDNTTNETASWLNVSYDATLKSLEIKVTGATETTRSATVTLYCGGNGNEATATLTVTQLGTQATLLLDPESIQLDSKGTAKTISVLTNQTDWEVVDASASTDFTISVDKEKKTITVSGTPLDAGMREHTYTVKAGDLEKQFSVKQQNAYKVGDPYMVNGKPVGIVYKVDETGMHGKAYALTVYNLGDKFFCYMKDTKFRFDDTNSPLSETDGKANQNLIMTIPGWETMCQMTKWTVDLAKEQEVDWYIPAIDELKEMMEVMSGAKYEMRLHEATQQYFETLPDVAEVNDAWNAVRALYKKYTTPEYGYSQEQYVIFERGEAPDRGDGRIDTVYDDNWNPIVTGDETGAYWFSSTVRKVDGFNRIMTIKFGRWMGNGVITDENYAEADWNDPAMYGGSIHPICQF